MTYLSLNECVRDKRDSTRGQRRSGSTHQGIVARVRFDGIVADMNNLGSGDA
jgi:hypothetical protein